MDGCLFVDVKLVGTEGHHIAFLKLEEDKRLINYKAKDDLYP